MSFPRGALLLLCAGGAAFAAIAAPKRAELQAQQQDLRNRIGSLQADLSKNEKSKAGVTEQLRAVEASISAANRKLQQLAENRHAIELQLNELERQSQQLARQVDNQQKQLSRLLYQQFIHGNDDALHLLLSGKDPNQTARDRYFMTLLSREKADLLGDMRSALQEKKRLAEVTREKSAELAGIEKQQQEGRAALLQQQKERQTLLARIAGDIKTQQKQINTLKADEKRLGNLIDNLARRSTASSKPRRHGNNTAPPPPSRPMPRGPDLANAGGEFAALRGKLPLPLHGTIIGRFGALRRDGATNWKGLFIRGGEGEEVRAVAKGTVVYADWLRGFGNLIILDHGDGFLSVYGNNQSLLRDSGKSVKAGETIAKAGAGDGIDESGLYFELRYQGQPFDPLRWINLK